MNATYGKIYLLPSLLAPDTENKVTTPYLKELIPAVSYFLVENVRTARRFISGLRLGVDIASLRFEVVDKDTTEHTVQLFLKPVLAGQDAGVISEAGCPAVADPGALVVAAAHRLGVQVVPMVGASSILLALMGSGMSGQAFAFHGYLPIASVERSKAIQQLEKESIVRQQTQIFMETPYRNQQLLAELLKTCRLTTRLCIASNLTASDEFIKTLTIKEWKNYALDINKKPTIFLLQA
jgi:16S rRNA (cytidine1402-2'-O)-methyltransferase